NSPAFPYIPLARRFARAARPDLINVIDQEVAHAIIDESGMRAGEDVPFRGDGDMTLPAAAAVDVGLGVIEEPSLGPHAAERRVADGPAGGAVETYRRTPGHPATKARIASAAAPRSSSDGKPGQFARAHSPFGRSRVMPCAPRSRASSRLRRRSRTLPGVSSR